MRAARIIAAVSIGAGALAVGPLVEPASAAVTVSSAGTAITVTVTGDAQIDFTCPGGKIAAGGITAAPALNCSALTQVTVNGDSGEQSVTGSRLNEATFAANPKIIATLNGGGDFISETRRADTISMGAGGDWVDLTAGGVANGSVDLGSDTGDYLAVNGTGLNDTISATSAGASVTVTTTNSNGVTTSSGTNAENLALRAGAGNDTITTTGVTAASTIDYISADGSLGDDTLTDGAVGSYLYGGPGTNTITGGAGQDSYWSESHTDTLNGGNDASGEFIYDTEGLRSGSRTLSGFTAVDTYTVQAHQGDVVQRIRPGSGGSTVFTTSLTRTGQQVVPAALGKLSLSQNYVGAVAHRGLADVVATDDTISANLPSTGNGIIDVTIPSGTPLVEFSGGTLVVTSGAYGTVSANNVSAYRVHGPWADKNQGFGHRVTRDLLFRFATNAQRDAIRDQLTNGTKTRLQVAQGLMSTDEYRGLDVDRTFVKYLRRTADPSGRTYWINSIADGKALWRFRAQLFGSNEYFTKAGGTNAAYVTRAYNDVLGRNPDPSGQTYWTNKLNNGADRGSVALQFINSPEARRRLVDDQFLRFLDRLPTAEEQANWVAQLPNANGEQAMIVALVSGATYYNRS